MASRAISGDSWKRRVSINAAGVLGLFTLLNILCFAAAPVPPELRLIGLFAPLALVVPLIARFESRWQVRGEAGFRRAAAMAWASAAVLPFLWCGMFVLAG